MTIANKDLSDEELKLKRQRQITLKMFGDEANELLEKIYVDFPDLKDKVDEARERQYASIRRSKKRAREKRKLARMTKEHISNTKAEEHDERQN